MANKGPQKIPEKKLTPTSKPALNKTAEKTQKKLDNQVKKKELQQQVHKTLEKFRNRIPNPNAVKTYLNKEGKVDMDKVKSHLVAIKVPTLYSLEKIHPGLMLSLLFTKRPDGTYIFKPANGEQEKLIGLADVLRFMPAVREVTINGHKATRRGLAGSFYFTQRGNRGYGAILGGYAVKIGKAAKEKEMKKIREQYAIKPEVQKVFNTEIAKLYPKSPTKQQLIISTAINEGIEPLAFIKIMKDAQNGNFPLGFQSLSVHTPFETMVRWSARMTRINQEKYEVITGLSARTDIPQKKKSKEKLPKVSADYSLYGKYSPQFIYFNIHGRLPGTMKAKYESQWRKTYSPRYSKPKFIDSRSFEKYSSPKLRQLKAAMDRTGIRQMPAESYRGKKTFDHLNGGQIRGKYEFPSNGVFAGTHMTSSKRLDEMKGQNATLDLVFPGIGGSARNRFNKAYNVLGGNRISAGIEDAFPTKLNKRGGPYYLWRNIRSLEDPQRKNALTTYLSSLITALEAQGVKINELTVNGHSGGGLMLHYFAKLFPGGEIPLKINGQNRIIRIKGYFAADSHYFHNTEFFNVYYAHKFKHAIMQDTQLVGMIRALHGANMPTAEKNALIKKITERIDKKCTDASLASFGYLQESLRYSQRKKGGYTLHRTANEVIHQMRQEVIKKALNGTIASWRPPRYHATALDTCWQHQMRLHRIARRFVNDVNSTQPSNVPVMAYNYNVRSHWKAFGDDLASALDLFDHFNK